MKSTLRVIFRIISAPIRGIHVIWTQIVRLISVPVNKLHLFFTETSQATSNPLGKTLGTVIEQPSLVIPHLNSLRKHVFRSLLAVFILSMLAFSLIKPILQFLAGPLPGGLDVLTAIDITENIGSVMKVALLSGFAASIPFIAFEIYLFFAPAIKPNSRFRNLFSIPLALAFFLAGMAFAYYVMLPAAIPFLFDFMGLTTQPRPSSYFNFITAVLFWIGLFFEFPMISYILARNGILKPQSLKTHWRLAVVIMAILAAAITPTVDPINMALVMGPMLILYFVAIGFTSIAYKKRQRENNTNL